MVQEQAEQHSEGLPVRLMFQDEARFGRTSDPRRCWAPPGVRPVVSSQIVREYEYAFAALSPHDGVLDTLAAPAHSYFLRITKITDLILAGRTQPQMTETPKQNF